MGGKLVKSKLHDFQNANASRPPSLPYKICHSFMRIICVIQIKLASALVIKKY